jgi:transcriptional regulator with XRE-family HTH domain
MTNVNSPNPGVQRRRLRAELRKARQQAELTQEQVASAMDWSLSKVIRIEAGSVGISTNDLKALLRLYKIFDEEQTAGLVALARAGRERSWQSAYRDVVSPRLLQLIEYEDAASIIRSFEPLLVPGLLQTEEYARAVLGQFAAPTTAERIDAQVEARMRRQELVDRDDPPLMFFVLDEAVTRRMVGGAAVMRRQVRKLVELAGRPHITIEIVPFGAGVHPGLQGPSVIYEFPDPPDDDVLFLENPLGDVINRDSPEEVLRYRVAFEELRKLSLGRDGSLTYLDDLAKEIM